MNFLELSNKKHKALETILNQLADLIDLETDDYVKSVSYRVRDNNKRYIKFTTYKKDNREDSRYNLFYNIDEHYFILDYCNGFGHDADSFYIR